MTKDVRYYWWDLSDIPLFFYRLLKHGLHELIFHGKLNIRMEFHPDKEEGLMLFNSRTKEEIGCYNWVHTCPPECT